MVCKGSGPKNQGANYTHIFHRVTIFSTERATAGMAEDAAAQGGGAAELLRLPVELLNDEQLSAKRAKRGLSLSCVKTTSADREMYQRWAQLVVDGLNAAEDGLRAMGGVPVTATNGQAHTTTLRNQRKVCTVLGGVVAQLRLAADKGTERVDKVFSQTDDMEDLTEEQKKANKQAEKAEKEQEAEAIKARKAAEAQSAKTAAEALKWQSGWPGQGGRGRYTPYSQGQRQESNFGSGWQNYGGGQAAPMAAAAPMPMMPMMPGAATGFQMQQPGLTMTYTGSPYGQQPVSDGWGGGSQYGTQNRPYRGPRPGGHLHCYGCGQQGHMRGDNMCSPENVDRFRALLRQQAAALAAGVSSVPGQPGSGAAATATAPTAIGQPALQFQGAGGGRTGGN